MTKSNSPLFLFIISLQTAFIFLSFGISHTAFSYIIRTAGLFILYLGLINLRQDPRFKLAYYLSLLIQLVNILLFFFLPTPYLPIVNCLQLLNSGLLCLLVILICQSFKQLLEQKKLAFKLMICCFLLLGIGGLGKYVLNFSFKLILAALLIYLFIVLWHTLSYIKKDILKTPGEYRVLTNKISLATIIVGYSLFLLLAAYGGFYSLTLRMYQYQEPHSDVVEKYPFNQQNKITQAEKTIAFSKDMEADIAYECYQKDNKQYHFVTVSWQRIPQNSYAVQTNTKYSHSSMDKVFLSDFNLTYHDENGRYQETGRNQPMQVAASINPSLENLQTHLSFITEDSCPLSECLIITQFNHHFQLVYDANQSNSSCQIVISLTDGQATISR